MADRSNSRKLELGRPPEAGAVSIERLVARALEGQIRVPHFQRGLKWRADNVLALFDSLRKGLPIGSLLFWKRIAAQGTVYLGPLRLEVPERADARWVVDGQQRLVALTASLSRPVPLPRGPVDPYVVYFDPAEETFHTPGSEGEVPDHWVALPHLLDATELSEFVHEWAYGANRAYRSALFEAGTRIRQYEVPVYTVETGDEDVLREIFYRINKSGKPLDWPDVYDALYGHDGSGDMTTLAELASHLSNLGFGKIAVESLTPVILAMRGLDVTRPLGQYLDKDRSILEGAAQQGAEVLPRVIAFLRRSHIPHIAFLPRMLVLESLARFFLLHPEPSGRSITLLSRWLWRVLTAVGGFEERTFRRHAVAQITEDEQASIQAMLQHAASVRTELRLDGASDTRSARCRLVLLGLSLFKPENLADGACIELAHLVENHGLSSLPRVIRGEPDNANRLLHPPSLAQLRNLLEARLQGERQDDNESILASHAITSEATRAYRQGKKDLFLSLRRAQIHDRLLGMACWDPLDRDRPSIEYLTSLDEVA
ncbi:DUF262 domain-containing protein [bacterium CPR1]|nr:DUF262 domain-containing protein [bacterium CPR1]